MWSFIDIEIQNSNDPGRLVRFCNSKTRCQVLQPNWPNFWQAFARKLLFLWEQGFWLKLSSYISLEKQALKKMLIKITKLSSKLAGYWGADNQGAGQNKKNLCERQAPADRVGES